MSNPRVAGMAALGFSSGMPFMLTGATFGYWLRDEGTELTAIGFLSWVGLAYTFKVFWAPMVDKVKLPVLGKLGQRRSWAILVQVIIAIALLAMATVGPHGPGGLAVMGAFALVVAFASATQDIAVDAWRIEEAKDADELGTFTSAYQLGYRIALLVTDALILVFANHLGWPDVLYDHGPADGRRPVRRPAHARAQAGSSRGQQIGRLAGDGSDTGSRMKAARLLCRRGPALLAAAIPADSGSGWKCSPCSAAPPRSEPSLPLSASRWPPAHSLGFPYTWVAGAALIAATVLSAFYGAIAGQDLIGGAPLFWPTILCLVGATLAAPPRIFDAFMGPLLEFFRAHGRIAFVMLLMISLYRLPEFVIGPVAGPFYSDLGLGKDVVGGVRASVGMLASIAGIAVGRHHGRSAWLPDEH